jgi:hypothetical protein
MTPCDMDARDYIIRIFHESSDACDDKNFLDETSAVKGMDEVCNKIPALDKVLTLHRITPK